MIKIDENNNKVVTYDNEPDVERQLFPNIPLTVDISPLQDEIDALDERVGAAEDDISSIQTTLQTFNGQPVVVDSVEDMTDENIIYVYVGDEAGYTSGDWYYYDGTEWVSGGAYVANPVVIDDTLTQAGEAADAKAVGDELTQIKSDFDELADPIFDTASGAIVTVTDGADDKAMRSLVCDIDPVQDLHGYANPWPGGGGKNLLNYADTTIATRITSVTDNGDGSFTVVASGASARIDHIIPVIAGETYVIKCERAVNDSGNASQIGVCAVYDGENTSDSTLLQGVSYTTAKTFTPSGNVVRVACFVTGGNGTGTGTIVKPQLEKGSTATTYEPYANICPISGHTGVDVYRTGKNLLPNPMAYGAIACYSSDGNAITRNGFYFHLPEGTYTIKPSRLSPDTGKVYSYLRCNVIAKDGSFKRYGYLSTDNNTTYYPLTFTLEAGDYLAFYCGADNSSGVILNSANIQVEVGSTATEYEPYAGQTIPVTFPSEAGTVYGGTLDVTTGLLTVDKAIVDLGTKNWVVYDHRFNSGNPISGAKSGEAVLCTMYAYDQGAANRTKDMAICISNNGYVYVYDTQFSGDADAFKSAMSGVMMVYPLVTPVEYDLDPVTVKTLLGINNVWNSTGDTTIDYPCDTKLYIERLTQPTEDDMVANANIASGKYFMVGNGLYLSTTTIPAGDTINPGTNCIRVSLADALNTINA